MLIRHAGERWHSPASESFDDEATLELLLKESPDLLPSSQGAPLAVVSQLYIPETGPADLIAVSTAGAITVVECKLKANPEIHRNVLGQVIAYASGLWKMPYEEFDALYAKRAGMPLAEHVRAAAELASADFDEEAFRAGIANALAQGNVGMVMAVDPITDELSRTVEFVNSHTLRRSTCWPWRLGTSRWGCRGAGTRSLRRRGGPREGSPDDTPVDRDRLPCCSERVR